MAINIQQPAVAELEVSLFGPGTGECIVVHLGAGNWMIVDSCAANNKRPVALEYLDLIGVSYDQVKLIVVSHFHDDHIKGINEVVSSCVNARVCISDALVAAESIAFASAYAQSDVLTDRGKPSTYELKELLEIIAGSGRSVVWAKESSVLYRDHGVAVSALSPSERAISQSKLDFAKEFSAAGAGYRRLAKSLTPNLCAVALHVCNGVDTVLLGSDLEISRTVHLGWEAVVASAVRPQTSAALFKIPHHGSSNGHYLPVVSDMLKPAPISIITTMNTHHLPLPEDLIRIKEYSSEVYHTTSPLVKLPKRDRAVEELMGAVTKSRRAMPRVVGHIQVRMTNGVMSVSLNEHASRAA